MSEVHAESGFTLSELVIVVFLMVMAAAVALPRLNELRRQAALRSVSHHLASRLVSCRALAIFHRRATGLVFEQLDDGRWRCFIAEDGDGDGIHRDDIDAVRDPPVGHVLELETGGAGLGILHNQAVPDPMGSGLLGGDLDDPIRAGRGNIITFTPRGTASPSSIYMTDHSSRMRVLRVLGITGRVRAMEWRSGWDRWRRVLL